MNEASLFLVCVFSLDRFVAVYFPLHRLRLLTRTRFCVLCLLSWVLPIILSCYPLFKGGHYYYSEILGYFVLHLEYQSVSEEKITFIASNALVIVPFCVTVAFCLAVLVRLGRYRAFGAGRHTPTTSRWRWSPCWKRRNTSLASRRGDIKLDVLSDDHTCKSTETFVCKSSEQQQPIPKAMTKISAVSAAIRSSAPQAHRPSPARNTNIVVLMITLYIICLLPGNLLNVYNMLAVLKLLHPSLTVASMPDSWLIAYIYASLIFSTLLYTLNSCFNPFIYYFRSHPILPVTLKRLFARLKIRLNTSFSSLWSRRSTTYKS